MHGRAIRLIMKASANRARLIGSCLVATCLLLFPGGDELTAQSKKKPADNAA